MIVDDSNFTGVCLVPLKDKTPTVVDSDAMVSLEIPFEKLKTISGRRAKVSQVSRRVEHIQLLQRRPEYLGRVLTNPAGWSIVEKIFRCLVAKGNDHSWATSARLYYLHGIRASRKGAISNTDNPPEKTLQHPGMQSCCRTHSRRAELRCHLILSTTSF